MATGTDNFVALKVKLSALFKDSVLNGNFAEFQENVKPHFGSVNENDVKNLLELTVREVLTDFLEQKAGPAILERVFQSSIDAAICDLCPGNLPVLVLSDMFDGSTLGECETIFAFIENRADIFKKDIFFRTCKNHLLRSCNDLLRRLSRSQNTVFCGRIQLFLARIFPLSERSGLNIISEFNLENTTIYSATDDGFSDGLEKDEPMEEGEITNRPITVDYNLYRKFWSLQDYFRNPNLCYNKMQWRHFLIYSSDILTVFGSFRSDDASSSHWKQTSRTAVANGVFSFFAKYLTSPKLLELELSDSNFRRTLLVQFLILFQYLTSQVKFKLETYALTEEQSNWVRDTTQRVYKLIEETPPDGPEFAKTVTQLLKREDFWNSWKNEGCPDFKNVDDKSSEKIEKPKVRLGDMIEQSDKLIVGNAELNRLWNICPINWEACKSKERKFIPSMESFFENAIHQADPSNQIEPQYKDVNDPKFSWKALRLLSMKSPDFFSVNNVNVQYKKNSDYIEALIQKIPKEKSSHLEVVDESETMEEETFEEGNDETLQSSGEDEPPRKDEGCFVKTKTKKKKKKKSSQLSSMVRRQKS